MSLANTGAPSIADSWNGQVTLPDGRILRGERVALPKKKFSFKARTTTYTYSGNDALYKKALKEPLQRGSKITGLLWFVFDGVGQKEFPPNGVQLTFRDINGKQYTAINNPKEESGPRYFYGLED